MRIGAVVENIIGGYLHPRASVRRLLTAGHGLDVALLMVLLAFLVREIFFIVTPGARSETVSLSLGRYVLHLVDALLSFAVFSVAICYVGRLFGGQGSLRQTGLVLAWYLPVTIAVVPLVLPAQGAPEGRRRAPRRVQQSRTSRRRGSAPRCRERRCRRRGPAPARGLPPAPPAHRRWRPAPGLSWAALPSAGSSGGGRGLLRR